MSKAHKPVQAPVRQTRRLAVAPFEGFDRNNIIFVPQGLIDDQLSGLTEGELKIMFCIIRATNSGHRQEVPLSVRMLCQGGVPEVLPGRGSGLSPRTVQAAVAALATAGYLKVEWRHANDGSGLPSRFSLPLFAPGMGVPPESGAPRFPGYNASRRMRLPLLVIDRLLAELSGAELRVLLYVLRHTFSQGIPDEIIPMFKLVQNTGLSLRHTRLAVNGLTARGILLVQHRQDRERGKLPSRFGVPVLGEVSALAVATSTSAVAPQPAEPVEAGRPVWLVPDRQPEPPHPTVIGGEGRSNPAQPEPAGIIQVFPDTIQPNGVQAPAAANGNGAASGRRVVPSELTSDLNPAWAAVKRILASRLPYPTFSERIATTHGVAAGGPELLVAVENEHHRWWVETKLRDHIARALVDAGYSHLPVRYLNYDGAIPLVPEES